MAQYQLNSTGSDLITQLMKSMGMTPSADLAGATDKQAIQLWSLATEAGQLLATEHSWQMLSREFTITTTIGLAEYDLPADFDGFESDAQWNRTTRLPVIGSLKQFEWQMLKARLLAGTTFTALFRVQGGQVVFYDTPSSVQTIVMPYRSRGWVESGTTPGTFQDNLIANADIVLYDPLLFKVAVKKRWYEEKQFDTSNIIKDYNKLLADAKADDVPGRTLSLAGGADYPYLGIINLPDTGYGA